MYILRCFDVLSPFGGVYVKIYESSYVLTNLFIFSKFVIAVLIFFFYCLDINVRQHFEE